MYSTASVKIFSKELLCLKQMWACSRGHSDAALALYRWNHSSLDMVNIYNQTAIDIAQSAGFSSLASEINKLKSDRQKMRAVSPSSQSKLVIISKF